MARFQPQWADWTTPVCSIGNNVPRHVTGHDNEAPRRNHIQFHQKIRLIGSGSGSFFFFFFFSSSSSSSSFSRNESNPPVQENPCSSSLKENEAETCEDNHLWNCWRRWIPTQRPSASFDARRAFVRNPPLVPQNAACDQGRPTAQRSVRFSKFTKGDGNIRGKRTKNWSDVHSCVKFHPLSHERIRNPPSKFPRPHRTHVRLLYMSSIVAPIVHELTQCGPFFNLGHLVGKPIRPLTT